MSEELLQKIPIERWPELQERFLQDWPRSIPGYNVLANQIRWRKLGIDYELQVYCPLGDVNNGFVAVNEKPSSYDLIIQYPNDDTKILEDALRKTKLIKWDKNRITLSFTAAHVISCLGNIAGDKNLELRVPPGDYLDTFVLEKDSPLFEDVRLPEGFTFDPLTSDHIELIDSVWPHKFPTSYLYFQLLIDAKAGYGLFKQGELISWILIGECSNLTHLYTVEKHRHKGYAELVLKLISNEILKMDMIVLAFCVQSNVNASKLYHKVGFKKTDEVSWGCLARKS